MGSMESAQPSIFSRIVAGEIPADIVYDGERIIAFRDIAPKAPVHLLVVPKTEQYRDVTELAAGDPALLAEIVSVAKRLAAEAGGDFRLVFNTGAGAGQTVFHVHAHVLSAGPGGSLEEGSLAD
jgi:histidine triad (HIT) family protein